ncbi:TetR/AcrR family transcriptional regulator [Sporichthya polymorpha]|uniref:TetR/AcrR family transcriptional regulator n=1 Tax=Sporichthya polymorpha TaxID=35751 RepID=UPI00035F2F96|nr:TetR/AcrR family transcriptional regulator [Sporichthya polymorpha]
MTEQEVAEVRTRTDRRRERTRGKLTDATRELIAEKGVAGLRIQEITERADVALGSFYNHFDSKEAVVEAVIADSLQNIAETLAADPVQDAAELVSIAIRRFVGLAYSDPEFASVVVHLNHADALFGVAVHPAARTAVQRGIAEKRFEVPDLEVAVTAILGGALAVMRAIVDGRLGKDAEIKYAEAALRSLGVSPADAAEVVRRPLKG